MAKRDRERKENKGKGFRNTCLWMMGGILLLGLLCLIPGFCDGYTRIVYPLIADGLGFLMGLVPFPVGEVLMYLGAVLVLLLIPGVLFAIFSPEAAGRRRWGRIYLKGMCIIVLSILLIYMLNWVIPFCRTPIGYEEDEYSLEEILTLRNYILEEYNIRATRLERDEEGHIILPEDEDKRIVEAMQGLGETYPLLKGYYPPFKQAMCADFLDWMSIGGYTYPYTMEVTYNKYVKTLRYPMLYAHEMSHHKGYYQEDEANFLSFLALKDCGESFLEYTAYREAFYYLDNAYYETLLEMAGYDQELALEEYEKQPGKSLLARWDNQEAQKAYEEQYKSQVNPFLEEHLSESVEKLGNAGWETQGKILKEKSYDGVVGLLLGYYYQEEKIER